MQPVGNRQANYSLSEAVRVTTEGIRMENSVLSDAAGVQKNISKMYEEYAKSLGKTTDSLSQAEKAQAVYNGIMNEAAMFTGSAAEMANGYQGIQAQVNATNLELSRTIGESMIPALTKCSSLQLSITKGLTEFASNHKGITSGIIIFTTTLKNEENNKYANCEGIHNIDFSSHVTNKMLSMEYMSRFWMPQRIC